MVKIFLAVILCSVIAYLFSKQIAGFFIAPLFEASPLMHGLVYTNLPEAFLSYIKLSVLIGFLASFPFVLFQIWAFVAPGMHTSEKKMAATVVLCGTLLFIGGASFALFGVLPKMLSYFLSYAHENLEPLPKLGKYLTLVARTILAFGLSFQIPFLMVMAGKANLVRAQYFQKKRVYFYAAIVVLAFLLTAGDFMATALLAIPLFGLYEAGIFLIRLFVKPNKSAEDNQQTGQF